jgi:hypothetical protein
VLRARHLARDDDTETAVDPAEAACPAKSVFIDSAPCPDRVRSGDAQTHRVFVLQVRRADQVIVVGGVILECNPDRPPQIDAELLEPIASALLSQTSPPASSPGPASL